MEIKIIFNEETETVENVIVGDKYTEQLAPDECIGLIAALVMPKERRCLQWLKTKEQFKAMRKSYATIKEQEDGSQFIDPVF